MARIFTFSKTHTETISAEVEVTVPFNPNELDQETTQRMFNFIMSTKAEDVFGSEFVYSSEWQFSVKETSTARTIRQDGKGISANFTITATRTI